MDKQNYERLTGRPARSKRVAATLAVLVVGIFMGTAQAETETGELVQQQPVILETGGFEQVNLDSQPLDAIPVQAVVEGVIVSDNGAALPVQDRKTNLAMVELPGSGVSANSLAVDSPQVNGVSGEGTNASGEGGKFPYALMLTLLALISLVPVSRRH